MPTSPESRQALVPLVCEVRDLGARSGRSIARTVKLSRREDTAVTVMSEILNVGASDLLRRFRMEEIVRQYDGVIARARATAA